MGRWEGAVGRAVGRGFVHLARACSRLGGMLRRRPPAATPVAAPKPDAAAAGDPADEALAEIAINAWTIARFVARSDMHATAPREAALLSACSASILDWLRTFDVTLPLLDGRRYVRGAMLDVAEWRADPAVRAATIVETLAPLVQRGNRRLRRPSVVVARPATDPEARGDKACPR